MTLKELDSHNNIKIWAALLHLSFNFAGGIAVYGGFRKEFEPDEKLWNDSLDKMAEVGVNMVLVNLDDSVKWSSHPEISVKNAWTPQRLNTELEKIRKRGIEPIPMLNFSTSHDAWMGEYSRMVSSQKYYSVCRNLISEALDIFEKPRFFHLGMDEESAEHQRSRYDYIVVRQNDLWWNDLYFYINEIEKKGSRPWIWSDYYWNHQEEFLKKMPKSVLQSNWYYGGDFNDTVFMSEKDQVIVKTYIDLDMQGYDQVPTSKFYNRVTHDCSIPYDSGDERSVLNTVRFCKEKISDSHLFGFLTTFWKPTTEKYRNRIISGIEEIGSSKRWCFKNIH
jgi:hypothetical protein